MTKIRINVDNNYKFLGFSMHENGIQNYSIHNSGSDIKPKSSPSTSDGKRNSPSTSDAQRNSPSTYDGKRNSPSTSDAQRHSPSSYDAQRSSTVFPKWVKTAKRGRKSLSTSTSSIEEQKEPVFANSKKDKNTRLPVNKKRKLQDIVSTEDGLKKERIEKETEADYRGEIMFDTLKKTYLEASHQQITTLPSETFNCAFCGKPFNSYQALVGHKSSCRSNPLKKEVVKSAVQDSNATSKIHRCKICSKESLTGQALGGHQKSHKTGEVEPLNESLHVFQSSTSSVREEQAEVPNKKIMMFDLNENPPEEDEDETELKL
ncbi:zinc finger protein ZAT9-like [Papaver somniferum]|uniref:zinc finger protein ZAT9-like n=1 Tax=Papaver somniferum TaxID=3469 RepID=UPI000E6FAFEA|nr:zinc finger protein ZAT9-like [Papaver somniferum]